MPRRPRVCPAGVCFHVLSRAVPRLPLFEKPEDDDAFERVIVESSGSLAHQSSASVVVSSQQAAIGANCALHNSYPANLRVTTTYGMRVLFGGDAPALVMIGH